MIFTHHLEYWEAVSSPEWMIGVVQQVGWPDSHPASPPAVVFAPLNDDSRGNLGRTPRRKLDGPLWGGADVGQPHKDALAPDRHRGLRPGEYVEMREHEERAVELPGLQTESCLPIGESLFQITVVHEPEVERQVENARQWTGDFVNAHAFVRRNVRSVVGAQGHDNNVVVQSVIDRCVHFEGERGGCHHGMWVDRRTGNAAGRLL